MPSNTVGTQRETGGQREYKKPSSPRPNRLLFSFSLQASDKKVPPAAPAPAAEAPAPPAAAAAAAATAPPPPPHHHHQPHRSLPVPPCRRHHHQLRAPCRALARVLAPARPNLPAQPPGPTSRSAPRAPPTTTTSTTSPAAPHHHHHNGRHRAVPPRPSGCHDVCIPCLDYLLSATSKKEFTACHCAWSSPSPIMGTRMSPRPVSFPPFFYCLFLLSFPTCLRLPFPLPFTFFFLSLFQPLCLHFLFLSLP